MKRIRGSISQKCVFFKSGSNHASGFDFVNTLMKSLSSTWKQRRKSVIPHKDQKIGYQPNRPVNPPCLGPAENSPPQAAENLDILGHFQLPTSGKQGIFCLRPPENKGGWLDDMGWSLTKYDRHNWWNFQNLRKTASKARENWEVDCWK